MIRLIKTIILFFSIISLFINYRLSLISIEILVGLKIIDIIKNGINSYGNDILKNKIENLSFWGKMCLKFYLKKESKFNKYKMVKDNYENILFAISFGLKYNPIKYLQNVYKYIEQENPNLIEVNKIIKSELITFLESIKKCSNATGIDGDIFFNRFTIITENRNENLPLLNQKPIFEIVDYWDSPCGRILFFHIKDNENLNFILLNEIKKYKY